MYELQPRVVAGQDFDMDSEVEGWNGVALVVFRKADGVFFSGEECVQAAVGATFGEALDFLFREAVVVGESFADIDGCAECLEFFLKTFGARDAGQSSDKFALEPFERELFSGVEVYEMERCVRALDNVSDAVMFPNGIDEGVVAGGLTFGEEDVVCSADVMDWLAQGAAGEEESIAKRCLRVHQTDFDTTSER